MNRVILIMIVPFIMVSTAFAQRVNWPADEQQNQDSVIMGSDGLISLDFRDANIQNVLEVLAIKSGVNIVASPDVTGSVSIQLKDVPWKQALDVILQTYGYAYEQQANIITVTTVEKLKQRREDAMLLAEQEPMLTEIFTLNFAKATEVISSIEKMKSERGSIDYDERTNMLIVTDTRKQIEKIAFVIKRLDKPTPQVLIEAKIIETTLTDTDKLGIDWTLAVTASGGQRPTTWPFGTTSNHNIFTTEDWPGVDDTLGSANTEFTYGTLNFTQVQAVFEMLKTRSDVNILSNPKIVTLDNKMAEITVGSQYPIPTYTYNEEQARLQVSGWEYKDIGIIFRVTPHVSNAGYVTLDIEPRITAILDFVTVENTSLPRLSNESAVTSVMIKDKETLVIAGLIKDQTTDTRSKTPFLGDIPLLGKLFQKKSVIKTKTDLMIFLTPHIITLNAPPGV